MKSVLILLLTTFSNLAHAQNLNGFTNAGTGCGPGTVSISVAPDGSTMTVLYSSLIAQAAGAVQSDSKDCEIYAWISKPKLATFVIESADFRGGILLEPGVEARQKVTVESGSTGPVMRAMSSFAEQVWRGPISQQYLMSTVRPIQAPAALSCIPLKKEGKIRIKVKSGVKSTSGAQGLLTVDSADAKVEQRYHLRWVNCISAGIDLLHGLESGRLF